MNYNDMMRNVAGATGLTRRQADDLTVSTLTVLAETISADETRDLLAQLPKSLRDRVPVTGERLMMRPIEFVARVNDLLATPTTEDVDRLVRAVLSVLTQAVNAGEMNDSAEQLGDEYAALLGRSERLHRETAPAPTPVVSTLLTSVGTAATDTALAIVARVVDVLRGQVRAGLRIAESVRR